VLDYGVLYVVHSTMNLLINPAKDIGHKLGKGVVEMVSVRVCGRQGTFSLGLYQLCQDGAEGEGGGLELQPKDPMYCVQYGQG
jgi:hypothetical protein